jgi:DNA repair protein RadD
MLEPRYHQRQAVEAFFNHARTAPDRNPLIVLPTGTGKSLVIAIIAEKVLRVGGRVMCFAHRKQLISQNHAEFAALSDFRDVGIHSAGLKSRDFENQMMFAGIDSAWKKAYFFGKINLIIVDEAHLVPQDSVGMYRKFFADSKKINSKLMILGLTATDYRLKGGRLTHGENTIFSDIIHETSIAEMVDPDHYLNLDNTQYLARPYPPEGGVDAKADMRGVRRVAGEYVESEMQERFMADDLVARSVAEIIRHTEGLRKVLIFTAGIEHAKEVYRCLPVMESAIVHSKQSAGQNDRAIEDFKSGQIKYLVNVNVLTTGFNDPSIDCIVLLRKTASPGLYVQMVGRGSRLFEGKTEFLVLDFGGNIDLHGPIDKINVRNPSKKDDDDGGPPVRECPECLELVHISVRECPGCGYQFPEPERHDEKASDAEILSTPKEPEVHEVTGVLYSRHKKSGKPDSMKVAYVCGQFMEFREWVCLDHGGGPAARARGWLDMHCPPDLSAFIDSVDEMLKAAPRFFRKPTHIRVDVNEKFPRVIEYSLPDAFPVNQEEVRDFIEREIIPF